MTLEEALKRKNTLSQTLQRLEGRLEAAQADKIKIEQEITDKRIDPTKLDEVIENLSTRKTELLTQLETALEEAEKSLQPYLSN